MKIIRELIGETVHKFFKDSDVKKEISKILCKVLRKKEIINSTPTPDTTIRVTIDCIEYDIPAQLVTTTTTTTTTSTTTTTTAAPTTTTTTTIPTTTTTTSSTTTTTTTP